MSSNDAEMSSNSTAMPANDTATSSNMTNPWFDPPPPPPHLNDTKLGVPNPDAAKVFNSTVNVTVDGSSPMMVIDQEDEFWRVESETGYRTHIADDHYGEIAHPLIRFTFVGTGFTLRGSSKIHAGMGSTDVSDPPGELQLKTILPSGDALNSTKVSGKDGLGSMSGFNLSSYYPTLEFSYAADIQFHNATFDIPIRTQAPDFNALKTQARYVDLIQNSTVTSDLSFESCSIPEELQVMSEVISGQTLVENYRPHGPPTHNILDGYLLIGKTTEAVYKVLQNTTLVEVLGPVGDHPDWEGFSTCYATFDPKPSWWNGLIPSTMSYKYINVKNQTLFLLPIDPTIDFTPRIGAAENDTCPISGIRTYPFHFDYTLYDQTSGNGTAGAASKEGGANTTGIIVGVVVGVVGGLLLLALAFWLWRRHRRQQQEEAEQLAAEPYIVDRTDMASTPEGRPLNETSSSQAANDRASLSSSSDDGSSEGEVRHARGIEEDNGSEIVEFLPPQYFDAWQEGPSQNASRATTQPSHAVSPTDSSGISPGGGSSGRSGSPHEPALKQEYRQLVPPRPALKEDYNRQFGRSLPPTPVSPRPLEAEYKRAYGRSEGNSSAGPALEADYKRAYGRSAESSSTPRLEADYKRAYGAGTENSSSAASRSPDAVISQQGSTRNLQDDYKEAFEYSSPEAISADQKR